MFYPEQIQTVPVMASATDAAGRSSEAISLKGVSGPVLIEVEVLQGNAATVAITPQQCTAVDGTGAKALSVAVPIWADQDVATNRGVMTRQTAAVSFTTSAALARKIVRFWVDPCTLDVAGGFDCLRFTTGASNVANLTVGRMIFTPKYIQSPSVTAGSN